MSFKCGVVEWFKYKECPHLCSSDGCRKRLPKKRATKNNINANRKKTWNNPYTKPSGHAGKIGKKEIRLLKAISD